MEEVLEDVQVVLADLAAVDHVEYLQEDEDVEDVGKVLDLGLRSQVGKSISIWVGGVEVVRL